MIKNYLRIALRNFRKQKAFTTLNIIGLSIGMAASLLILQYVRYEKSYDTFHTKSDRIYRVQYNGYRAGKLNFECAAAVPAVSHALKDNFAEVEQVTRLFPVSGVVSYESPDRGLISFRERKMQITEPSVFEVFDFKLVKGDTKTSLQGPNKAVVSQHAARKYFGDEDPIGKNISWDGEHNFEITGIMADVPDNSHIKFDFMLSYQTLSDATENAAETSWGWYDFNTYVLLKPGTDVSALQAKWDQFLEKERAADWEKYNSRQEFILQPMLGIHLYSNLLQESEPEEQGDGDAVYALSVIAFFILLIAWVNYINLATAKSFDRANEIGVRKVMGAQKAQLVKQFLAEALLVNLMATLLALVLVRVSWSFLNEFTGRAIPLSYLLAPSFWLLVLGLFAAGGALSGFYPAMVLSSFNPVSVLKGKLVRSAHGSLVRKSLVVFQFLASVFLICGSLVVYQQLQFMRQQKLGVDINQTLVLRGPGVVDSLYEQNKESFKNEMLRIPGVRAVTTSSNVPGDEIFWTNGIRRLTGSDNALTVYNVGIDFDYVPAFGLELAAGRNFDRSFSNDSERVLINRELAASLAFDAPEEAIGQKLSVGGDTLEVAGVLENYHQMSLKTKVAPIVFRLVNNSSFYAFKMETENYQDVLDKIEPVWKDLFPGNPIEYFFLDQFFNRQYASDRQFGQLFSLFTILAIFVACLGLFGLASFMTVQRTKEIGIRKVMGSSVAGIIILLSKGFIQLVLIANLIAWPLAWWAMSRWLESFPYHTTINPLLFLAAGCSVVFIAFLSVGLQTFKAASVNPSKSLKYE